jgi:hypothetical protein
MEDSVPVPFHLLHNAFYNTKALWLLLRKVYANESVPAIVERITREAARQERNKERRDRNKDPQKKARVEAK